MPRPIVIVAPHRRRTRIDGISNENRSGRGLKSTKSLALGGVCAGEWIVGQNRLNKEDQAGNQALSIKRCVGGWFTQLTLPRNLKKSGREKHERPGQLL